MNKNGILFIYLFLFPLWSVNVDIITFGMKFIISEEFKCYFNELKLDKQTRLH